MRFLLFFWSILELSRKMVLNLVFLLLIVFLIASFIAVDDLNIKENTALVVAPYGHVVEQLEGNAADRAIQKLMDREKPQTLFRNLIKAIELAKTDERISVLVLNPDYIWSIGLANLQELSEAIDDFKLSEKPVIAISSGMNQHQYYFATLADEIVMHPFGFVFIEGYGRFRNYYKEGLDKLGVNVHLFRVGKYKSYAEPYIRNSMSEDAKESNLKWMNSIWSRYLEEVAPRRGKTADEFRQHISNHAEELKLADGDSARLALNNNYIDQLLTKDEMDNYIIQYATKDSKNQTFRQISYDAYLQKALPFSIKKDQQIEVIVAQGAIQRGEQSPGTVGSETISAVFREARNNEKVSAIVLRIDSPGGDVFASEIVRKQVEITQKMGKPVIVSMGNIATSGGYWIAMNADKILANPSTITGSIGVFGLFTTFPDTLAKIGIYTDGVGTTSLAGAARPDKALEPQISEIIQTVTEKYYEQFINMVADSRNMPEDLVREIAQGRVWSGEQALKYGLIDELGGIQEAISAAAELADLGDDYSVHYSQSDSNPLDFFLAKLASSQFKISSALPEILSIVGGSSIESDLKLLLKQSNSIMNANAYCFCTLKSN